MRSVITMVALGVLLLNTGCETQKAVKPEPLPPPKTHQFSVVDGTAGLIALRDDGKSCRTADIVCAKKDGTATTEGRGPSGVSCSQLALTPLCSDLDKKLNDPLGIR
jgi:hypothetical protein